MARLWGAPFNMVENPPPKIEHVKEELNNMEELTKRERDYLEIWLLFSIEKKENTLKELKNLYNNKTTCQTEAIQEHLDIENMFSENTQHTPSCVPPILKFDFKNKKGFNGALTTP